MPSRQSNSQNQNPTQKAPILLIAIVSISSFLTVSAILYFLYHLYFSLVKRSRTSPFDSNPNLQRFSYKELKSATNSFTETIGKGGSGAVFRGILRDGKLVAVKVVSTSLPQGELEFQNELQILGSLGLKSPHIVTLLGFCVEKGHRLLVYEYMPNRSLQEYIFSENSCLDWGERFEIIKDIARALEFLHIECDPPIIHGDVKPSNVLLDSEYRAKVSDFGLSRWKIEGEFGIDLFSQELSGNLGVSGVETPLESVGEEVDFSLAIQASSSSKITKVFPNLKSLNSSPCFCNGSENGGKRIKGKEVSTLDNGVVYDDEVLSSVEYSKEMSLRDGEKKWGKDWWWRQDGSAELCSKDYVMEWIGSQICPSKNTEWEEGKKSFSKKMSLDNSIRFDANENREEYQSQEPKFEYPKEDLENKDPILEWKTNKKHRKMQEWWKEEHLDEISNKTSKLKRFQNKWKKGFKIPRSELLCRIQFKSKKIGKHNQDERNPNEEFSFRKGRKKKNNQSPASEMSGDLFSRELSSTTSMRGTLCYVAPEYGGCGYLMEKSDIYSLGVLILVIVSGRRPLHVLSSPMKLEKANLISWCRQLAQSGNVLELVDEKLKEEYNKEQASLCINLALACLQKMPELRPDIGIIVKILKGEIGLSSFVFEFSPSPPSKTYSASRRKQKGNNSDKV